MIDITVGLENGLPVWPGDPRPEIGKFLDRAQGHAANATMLHCSAHAGTHVDAPNHYLDGKQTSVDTLDLNRFLGRCFVAELPSAKNIDAQALESLKLPKDAQRILFKTSNSTLWENPRHSFYKDFVALTVDGAEYLSKLPNLLLVGIDYLSIQRFADKDPLTHQLLLKKEIGILEGLDLRKAQQGWYELVCLPMKIMGSDGAPARAILLKDKHS